MIPLFAEVFNLRIVEVGQVDLQKTVLDHEMEGYIKN